MNPNNFTFHISHFPIIYQLTFTRFEKGQVPNAKLLIIASKGGLG